MLVIGAMKHMGVASKFTVMHGKTSQHLFFGIHVSLFYQLAGLRGVFVL